MSRRSCQQCRASSSQDQKVEQGSMDEESAPAASVPSEPVAERKTGASSTLSNLNMILGIDEEAERAGREAEEAKDIGIVQRSMAAPASDPAAGKDVTGDRDAGKNSSIEEEVSEQMVKLVQQVQKLRSDQAAKSTEDGSAKPDSIVDEEQLRKDFENLITMIRPDGGVTREDLKLLKEQVFGPMTFWVTETRLSPEQDGYIIRGNLRAPAEKVFPQVISQVRQLFKGKFEILIIEDPEIPEIPPADGDQLRPAFKLVPSSAAYPAPPTTWQSFVSFVLITLTFGTCMQLGLVAEISRLPAETLQWLLNPDNLNQPDAVPPGLESFDAVSYVNAAVPIALITLGLQGIHEIGHRVAAGISGTKLGPSFLIPNGQLGSFGSVTQIKSLLRDLKELFDVSAAGPLAGGAASLAIFAAGLALTAQTQQAGLSGDLIPIPPQLLQGSLGLGVLASSALGTAGSAGSQVLVHPLMIAGWVGVYTTALNLLPVGCLDGGRIVQAAFGRGALSATSFITYLGLALGLLGGPLALPFGLYVLVLQRPPEKYIQDSVSDIGEARRTLATALVVLAFFVLLPNVPDLPDAVDGVGPEYFL